VPEPKAMARSRSVRRHEALQFLGPGSNNSACHAELSASKAVLFIEIWFGSEFIHFSGGEFSFDYFAPFDFNFLVL